MYEKVKVKATGAAHWRRKSDKQQPVYKKDKKRDDLKISQCLNCGWGIFKTQEYTWAGTKGLVHVNCEDKKAHEVKDTT